MVSPVLPVYCPQDRLEPVLLQHLRALGGEVRFGVELTDLVDDGAGVTAMLRDRGTGIESSVQARFVVGADGTRSVVRRALGIRMQRLGEHVYTLFTADLDGLLGAPVPLQVLGTGRELVCDADLLARRYGLAHGGAVLVGPDGHVAWTCTRAVEPLTQLLKALNRTCPFHLVPRLRLVRKPNPSRIIRPHSLVTASAIDRPWIWRV